MLFSVAQLCAQSITAERIPAAIADGGGAGTTGTPYAVFVRIQGWVAAANSQAYLKLYSSTNNEYMWSATGTWSNVTAYNSANQPVVSIDASGNWAGWIYAKHNTALGVSAAVRAAKVAATGTNLTSGAKTFSILNMSTGGNGGWLFRPSSPAVNKGIVAYAGGAMVGTYRTEDNSVSEGYAYGPGGFKIAVPLGFIDSLVVFNDDGSRDQLFAGPWNIVAGGETDASQQGGTGGPGTAVVVPSMLTGGVPQAFSVRIAGAPSFVLRAASVVIPKQWNWSHTTADVAATGPGTPQVSTSGDTVVVTGLAVGPSDTASLSLSNITPYDTTAYVSIPVLTGPAGDSLAQIRAIPVVFIHSTPLNIGTAKENDANGVPLQNNTWVTVRGVVTVANEFGGASYIQDNSGGLTVYGSSFSSSVNLGDEVIVAGLVQPFNGLTEIVTPLLLTTVSRGNTVEPLLVTAAQIAGDGVGGLEQLECRLVRVNGVSVAGVSVWGAGTNYVLTDASGSTQIRIDKNTSLVGKPSPASVFDVVGVVGQYATQPPYIGGYQLMPRSPADIFASGPIIATAPEETDIQPTGLTASWKTVTTGTTRVRYGVTRSFELGIAGDDQQVLDHAVAIQGLTPATVYYIQAFSVAGADTSFAQTLIASTASPAWTTGVINVYFNKSIDSSVAWQQSANGNQDLVSYLIRRINNARCSIDAALYSLSGTPGPGTDIANALIGAANRGIRVRVICENDNRNTSPFTALVSSGIPLISDTFDPVNAGAGLMHNKFFIIDARGGAPESVWVWTGSWNPTDPGTNNDYQNVVELQDQALAGAYTLEFNEMWGSDTDLPVASASRFGARKTDNTPHRFVIGGRKVECYFSPSDRTTSKILDVINGAHHSVAFALLTLTRTDVSAALVAKKTAGMKVRGVLDNGTDSGSQYTILSNAGVDVHLKSGPGSSGYLLHHKYGVVDAEDPLWAPATITGSHNWSNSAETSNNENTLIVHDHGVANQFLQEFTARYYQYGGVDSIRVGVAQEDGIPTAHRLYQNFPNPFNPETTVRFSIASSGWVSLRVYDILGREVETLLDRPMVPGIYGARFDGKARASGIYVVRLTIGAFVEVRKMVLVR
jgi:phosphatidylserine/phosphatidylglycerophosphate/cardiolipin synthase-like enzyme